MKYIKERQDIVEVGKELLKTKLVARTWGNISAREDGDNFLITPSGLDYVTMTNEDIVSVNMTSSEWTGKHRPSGERGVHKAAYQVFEDVNFVVHTHQTYATAIGLAGFEALDITEEENEKLGGVALAAYGLPSSEKLINGVTDALKTGAHCILMIHHGVLVLGKDREEAMERTKLLEDVCKRNIKIDCLDESDDEQISFLKREIDSNFRADVESGRVNGPIVEIVSTPELIKLANRNKSIVAQLDDISQMIGVKVKAVDAKHVLRALRKTNAVLVKGVGAVIKAEDEGDAEALDVLLNKMAIVKLHTECYGKKATIGLIDSVGMHYNYVTNYSKQKK